MTELNKAIADIPVPGRMQGLPISDKGFPIPWFVYIDPATGKSDFRVLGPGKIEAAYQKKLCWLCGQKLGVYMCFTIGPMCTVNRISAEPPSHLTCAEYAVRACPFLNNPAMRRNEKDMHPEGKELPGTMLKRNPGVTALWITKEYFPVRADKGFLFNIGRPVKVYWYAEGKVASREQVQASIDSGLPILEQMAWAQGREAHNKYELAVAASRQQLPQPEGER